MPRPRDNARKEVRANMSAITDPQARALLSEHARIVDRIAGDYPFHDADELRAVGSVAVLEAFVTHEPARAPLRSWITTTVRWRIGEVVQREVSRLDRPRIEEAPEPLTNGRHDPERRFQLDEIIELLPYLTPQHAVIITARLRGETFEEIGKSLGFSASNAHEQHGIGVAQLRIWIRFGVT